MIILRLLPLILFGLLLLELQLTPAVLHAESISIDSEISRDLFRSKRARRTFRRFTGRERVRIIEKRDQVRRARLISSESLGSDSSVISNLSGLKRIILRLKAPQRLRKKIRRVTLDGQLKRKRFKRLLLPRTCGVSTLKIWLHGVRAPIEHKITRDFNDHNGQSICSDGETDQEEQDPVVSPSPSRPEPTPSQQIELIYTINAGGTSTVVDGSGRNWIPDGDFVSSGSQGTYAVPEVFGSGGIPQDVLRRERYGSINYEIPLDSGEYKVKLHFVELFWSRAQERVFDVTVEGIQVKSALDLFATVGELVPYPVTFQGEVVDGSLSIELDSLVNWGTLSAIEIWRIGSGGEPTEPTPTPTPDPHGGGELSGVWANSGEDKVTRDELRYTLGQAQPNYVWDGEKVTLKADKNEVIAFNTILEAATEVVEINHFELSHLSGPGGYILHNGAAEGDELFNWVDREIEHFYVRYLEIKGLSRLFYEHYDERHIPSRLQRPYTGEGFGYGSWQDRPGANKEFPDIAVPLDLELPFTIAAGSNQSIWTDIFVPKDAPAGDYSGTLQIVESGGEVRTILVELEVLNFVLPDEPNSKTMLYLGYMDTNLRYLGEAYPQGAYNKALSEKIRDRHFLIARRHKISLIDSNRGSDAWPHDAPRPAWNSRLDGSLFTAENGYDGPGIGLGNNVYSIGTYGTWSWQGGDEATMWERTDNWASWFHDNSPETEIFLYLIDESSDYEQTNTWASWMDSNPGIGSTIPSFATASLPSAMHHMPNLDIAAGWMATGITDQWQSAADYLNATPGKSAYMYNGKRPAAGSFAIEDDGVSLRQLPWAQYKKNISRWFYWESTYYNNFQGGTGQTDVFNSAFTFGTNTGFNPVIGETGWNYSNGDGVLFYPGTDTVFPDSSYGIKGPIVSLRMKHWRRGIQDVDYLTLAAAVDPVATAQIVQDMNPEVLWEPGVSDPGDPTWNRTDISWSIDPDDWEDARSALIDIILDN